MLLLLACPDAALLLQRGQQSGVLPLRAEEPQQRLRQRVALLRQQRRHALQLAVVRPVRPHGPRRRGRGGGGGGQGRAGHGSGGLRTAPPPIREGGREGGKGSSYILVPAGQERHHGGPATGKAGQQSRNQNLHRSGVVQSRHTYTHIHTHGDKALHCTALHCTAGSSTHSPSPAARPGGCRPPDPPPPSSVQTQTQTDTQTDRHTDRQTDTRHFSK